MKRRRDSILKSCANITLPIIITLGLYVILHGHLSPGGGFQGGVLVAGALAIIYVCYGSNGVNEKFNLNKFKFFENIGALGFILLAFLGLIYGGTFFKNIFGTGNPGELFSSGNIFLMNFAVGFKVFAGISFLIVIMVKVLNKKEDDDVN